MPSAHHALHVSGALLTDLYELTMVDSYLRGQMTAPAAFSLFVRDLPTNRGFLVARFEADLAELPEEARDLRFSDRPDPGDNTATASAHQ
ncbi:hypothetical protein IFM12275_15340 [Nocardia sputorum]|nr:hypothetical protein IFM12275_15340 [Nocardia sputorum]